MTKNTEIEFAEMMEKAETIKFCMLTTQAGLNRLKSRPLYDAKNSIGWNSMVFDGARIRYSE